MKHITQKKHFNLLNNPVLEALFIILILQMRKRRHREVRQVLVTQLVKW